LPWHIVAPEINAHGAQHQKRNSQDDRGVLGHLAGVDNGKSFGTDLNGPAVDLLAVLAMPAYGSGENFQGFIGSRVVDQYSLRIEIGFDFVHAQHFVHRGLCPAAIIENASLRGTLANSA
jgi:hypothetical protein